MAKVTVLGLGAMGSRMAANLLKAGHAVTVWNRDPAKAAPLAAAGAVVAATPVLRAMGAAIHHAGPAGCGAVVAATPRAAVRDAEFAISMVRDDGASRHVWLDADTGALAGLPRTAVALESSTLTVGWVRELAGAFRAAGVRFLDAPVAGSLPQAEAAQLVYLVGGEADAVAAATPVLRAMGAAIHHAGPAGCGAAVKLMVNTLLGVQVAAWAELLGVMRACGMDDKRAVEIVAATAVCSPAAKAAAGGMLARTYSPMFPVELIEKDLGYAEHLAAGGPAPITEAARKVFAEATARGRGGENMTAVAELYR